jgi:hypothetical protein
MATITTISPITAEPVLTRTSLTESEIPGLVSRSRAAFESFQESHATLESRKQIINRFLELLLQKKDEIAKDITEQMGRPIRYTAKEVETAVKRAQFMVRISDEVLKTEVSAEADAEEGVKKYVTKEPWGVCLSVFAWNVCPPHPVFVRGGVWLDYFVFPFQPPPASIRPAYGPNTDRRVVPLAHSRQLFNPCHPRRKCSHHQTLSPDTHSR